jgi:mRNA interferase RelE/StbE
MYRHKLTHKARRELEKAGKEDYSRLLSTLEKIVENLRPPGVIKLFGHVYRIRIGYWRIIYEIHDQEQLVVIGKIARRSGDTYHDARDLF